MDFTSILFAGLGKLSATSPACVFITNMVPARSSKSIPKIIPSHLMAFIILTALLTENGIHL